MKIVGSVRAPNGSVPRRSATSATPTMSALKRYTPSIVRTRVVSFGFGPAPSTPEYGPA